MSVRNPFPNGVDLPPMRRLGEWVTYRGSAHPWLVVQPAIDGSGSAIVAQKLPSGRVQENVALAEELTP